MSFKDKVTKLLPANPQRDELGKTLDGTNEKLNEVVKRLRERLEQKQRKTGTDPVAA